MDQMNAVILKLLKAYVTGVPATVHLTADEWRAVYRLADKQSVAPFVGAALNVCDTDIDLNLAKRFIRNSTKTGHVYSLQNREYRRIAAALGEKGIRTLYFKGSFLGQYYPDPMLRSSCDIDVLYPQEHREEVGTIMESLGYTKKGETLKEDEWFLEPCVAVEMHFSLFRPDGCTSMRTFDPWPEAVETGDLPLQYVMRREDQYVFMLLHFVKHLREYGVSLRQILDFEFFLRKEQEQFDRQVLNELLEKDGLVRMDAAIRHLLDTWFRDGERDQNDEALESFLFNSGLTGASNNTQSRKVAESGNNGSGTKFQYYIFRIFPPAGFIHERYPVTERHKILTPLYYVVRWVQVLRPSSRRRITKETKTVRSFSDTEMQNAAIISELTGDAVK